MTGNTLGLDRAIAEASKRAKATCDHCKARFGVNLLATPIDNGPFAGGEYQRFLCRWCQHEYPVCSISAHGVRLRERMEVLQRMVSRAYSESRWSEELQGVRKQFEREVRKGERPPL
jgi:hypothetical protein